MSAGSSSPSSTQVPAVPAVPAIDVHHHFYPSGKTNEGVGWSIDGSMDELDSNGVAAAIASLPPVRDAEPSKAREWNEWATRLCQDRPGRLGLFATLPLRDMDLCLAEIAHAYDVLKVDGVGLPTSDVDVWLGDARFQPMFAELDRRRAVIFVHPYATSHCAALSRAYGGDLVSPPWIEFPANTARCILSLLMSGVPRKCPAIRFIFCHGGGLMPLLPGRIAGFAGWDTVGPARLEAAFPDGIYAEFAKLYFDCAQAYAPEVQGLLRQLIPPSHLLFGTDYSYFPVSHSMTELSRLQLDGRTRHAIMRGNAAALFPRFAG